MAKTAKTKASGAAKKKRSASKSRKTKTAKKSKKTKAVTKKRSLFSSVDQRLMAMATTRYEQVFQAISEQSHRLNEDRKLALEIGQRVLQKVRSVQGSFSPTAVGHAVLDLNLLKKLRSARTRKPLRKSVSKETQV